MYENTLKQILISDYLYFAGEMAKIFSTKFVNRSKSSFNVIKEIHLNFYSGVDKYGLGKNCRAGFRMCISNIIGR